MVDNTSTSEIDELALQIEHLIAENSEALKQYEENQPSPAEDSYSSGAAEDVDLEKLFS